MKKYFLLALSLCFAWNVQAQMSAEDQRLLDEQMADEADMMLEMEERFNGFTTSVDEAAQHLEGADGLNRHLMNYQAVSTGDTRERTVTVMVEVFVDANGAPVKFNVAKSDNPKMNNRALAALSGITRWTPARKNGRAIASKLTVPVRF